MVSQYYHDDKTLNKLSSDGNAEAQFFIGQKHLFGERREYDPKKAFLYFKESADKGFPPSVYNCGVMLIRGIGTNANSNEGMKLLELAYKAGIDYDEKLQLIRFVA